MSTTLEVPRLALSLELAGTLMTPEEFDAIEEYDEDYRYELIHGVLVVTAIPLPQETGPNDMLGYMLLAYQITHPKGKILDGTLPEQHVRTADSRRRADRLIWTGLGRTPKRKEDLPSVVVEFVSASRRDRQRDYVENRHEYMERRIGEYWIFDRFRRTLTVVRYHPDEPEEIVVPEAGTYQTPLLPGFELQVGELLAVADQWAEAEQ